MVIQLVVTGSRTVLESYDVILGTLFLFQHRVGIAFNTSKLAIGLNESLPMDGKQVAAILSIAADVLKGKLNKICSQLCQEAKDLCKNVDETNLSLS